jgi:hypothetical protein
LRAAKTLGSRRVPLHGLWDLTRFFAQLRQLEGHHAVARALEEFGELCRRVGRCFCLADAGLYLSPICHARAL